MQFDKDIQGTHSRIFRKIRSIILSFEGIKEIKNANQTTYKDRYGRTVCMMRGRDESFVLALAQGSKLEAKYPFLEGCRKIVRHLHFKKINDVDETQLSEMFEDALILNIEDRELKKLKRSL